MVDCVQDCLELSLPSSAIFNVPPPAPFISDYKTQNDHHFNNITVVCPIVNPPTCNSWPGLRLTFDIDGYVELPVKEDVWSDVGIKVWLIIVFVSIIAMLLLGVSLLIVLHKCVRSDYYSTPSIDADSISNKDAFTAEQRSTNSIVWAALTPNGSTQHFVENVSTAKKLELYGSRTASAAGGINNDCSTAGRLINNNAQQHATYSYDDKTRTSSDSISDANSRSRSSRRLGLVMQCDRMGASSAMNTKNQRSSRRRTSINRDEEEALRSPSQGSRKAVMLMSGGSAKLPAHHQAHRETRPHISEPTTIDQPSLPPLNMCPSRTATYSTTYDDDVLRKKFYRHYKKTDSLRL